MQFQIRHAVRATGTLALLSCVVLTACDSKPDTVAAPEKSQPSAVTKMVKAAVSGPEKQFTCTIDEVNIRLDLGNMGNTQVMALPSIGATPISKNVLLLDASSAEEAANKIMAAKEEYKRIPPQCDVYKLSTRDAKLDTSTPLEQYVPLKSGEQMAYLFYAVSKLPVPHDQVAKQLYPAYRGEPDSFKRLDMLKTLQPEIDEKVRAADGQRLLMIETTAKMMHYDQATKSFRIKLESISFNPGAYIRLGESTRDYHMRFDAQGKEDLQYVPADENEARTLEALVTSRGNPRVQNPISRMTTRIYVQAVKAAEDGAAKDIMAKVMHVDVIDKECPTCANDGRPGDRIAQIKMH